MGILHKTRKARGAVLAAVFFLAAGFVAAQEQAVNRTVQAGVFNFEGYHSKDAQGNLYGYGIEFLELVSEYSHLNFEYVGYDKSWDQMLAMLESGEIDMVTSARKTAERENNFAFSLPIGRNNTVLSVKSDNTRLYGGDYRTYDGMTVGIIDGSSQNDILVDFARSHGFSYKTRKYDDAQKLAADLQNGTIDAILSSNLRKTTDEKTLD
ncbi:MAG: transporter substrate-binding domain-containing protein, partial [Treponemataceae bacterium]|nr:transporter substrate-binding domain-containing protein [Treponemataceae bacterium]